MPSPQSIPMFARGWSRLRTLCACSALVLVLARPVVGQSPATVEALAAVLAAEDARRYDGPVLLRAAHDPETSVRRHAALAIGRIGNRAGLRTLLELVNDPDTTVAADAVFATGLLRDEGALPKLRDLMFNTPPDQQTAVQAEAATAVAKIGGPDAARILTDLLDRWASRA